MAGRLAILSGSGALPVALSSAHPHAYCVGFDGVAHALARVDSTHAFEEMGGLFATLKAAGVTEVVLAGGMSRPALDPARFDAVMRDLAPRLVAAMQGGDDGLLRFVIGVFEEQGFAVRGAHELLPDLTAAPGLLVGPEPSEVAMADALQAADILRALGPLDIGQGAVVAGGLCLGIETLQGTDALLRFVAQTPAALRPKAPGVLVKYPKAGQDLRVDMPAIGPDTVRNVAQAGLGGIVILPGQVVVLERADLIAAAEAAALFVLAREF